MRALHEAIIRPDRCPTTAEKFGLFGPAVKYQTFSVLVGQHGRAEIAFSKGLHLRIF